MEKNGDLEIERKAFETDRVISRERERGREKCRH